MCMGWGEGEGGAGLRQWTKKGIREIVHSRQLPPKQLWDELRRKGQDLETYWRVIIPNNYKKMRRAKEMMVANTESLLLVSTVSHVSYTCPGVVSFSDLVHSILTATLCQRGQQHPRFTEEEAET